MDIENIKKIYNVFLKYRKISTDSRIIKKNDIFFALSGENFNGNIFAENALEKGA
jgi:UDP-N-acetylmuramoyl-tripeptide--D-alanyl-D-alanine ligase